MSTYAPAVAIFLLVLSPLYIPIAVTLVHGVSLWRANRGITKRDRQQTLVRGKALAAQARPQLRATEQTAAA
jgi:hypothetical protein